MEFDVLADHKLKMKESEKINKYLDLAKELKKKLGNMRVEMKPIFKWRTRNGPQSLEKNTWRLRNQRKNRVPPVHSIIKIG